MPKKPDHDIRSVAALDICPMALDFIDPDSADWDKTVLPTKVILKDKKVRVRLKIIGITEPSWRKISQLGLNEFKLTNL